MLPFARAFVVSFDFWDMCDWEMFALDIAYGHACTRATKTTLEYKSDVRPSPTIVLKIVFETVTTNYSIWNIHNDLFNVMNMCAL